MHLPDASLGSGVGLGSESEKSCSLPESPGFNHVGKFGGSGRAVVRKMSSSRIGLL